MRIAISLYTLVLGLLLFLFNIHIFHINLIKILMQQNLKIFLRAINWKSETSYFNDVISLRKLTNSKKLINNSDLFFYIEVISQAMHFLNQVMMVGRRAHQLYHQFKKGFNTNIRKGLLDNLEDCIWCLIFLKGISTQKSLYKILVKQTLVKLNKNTYMSLYV
ncbi:hypothetical protein QTP88_024276 [Uroleucon formosanum]